jgi:predicted DCC family thiol-disulfide oxidoreductase YuxK
VQFVLDHEGARHDLRFATLAGATGSRYSSEDSMVWLEPATGEHYTRYHAALRVASYLGGPWRLLAAIGRAVPTAVGNAAYDFIARHRHSMSGGDACVIPTPSQRARFLD